MIPLTTNVRLQHGLPPAVTGIILLTLYFILCATYPGLFFVVLLPWFLFLAYLYRRTKIEPLKRRAVVLLAVLTVLLLALDCVLAVIYPDLSDYLLPDFSYFKPLLFQVVFRDDQPDLADCFLSIFSHANLLHWFWNAVYLWIFGSILEDRIGWKKFLGLFILCGLFANFLEWAYYDIYYHLAGVQKWKEGGLGASGAVFGIMGLTMFRFYNAKVWVSGIPFLYNWTYMGFAIPIWLFCGYRVIFEAYLFSLSREGDHVSHICHLGGFLTGWIAARFLKFDKENVLETQLNYANGLYQEGAYRMAEDEFRSLLKAHPEDLEVRFGLAESLLDQSIRGFRRDPRKKSEALVHYLWILDRLNREEKAGEAADLYQTLLGPYTREELGEKHAFLASANAKKSGKIIVEDEESYLRKREKLFSDFNALESTGKYKKAYGVLGEILQGNEVHLLEPSFLARAGEVALRIKDIGMAERLFESVAKRGDMPQTVRALDVLSRYWLKGRKQLDLHFLYKTSAQRFSEIHLFPEWVELGTKLK